MESVDNPIVSQLQSLLGERLVLLVQTGGAGQSGSSAGHPSAGRLHIILRDGTSMLDNAPALADAMAAATLDAADPPILAARTPYLRHLQLNHVQQYQIARSGQILAGDEALLTSRIARVDAHLAYAQIAAELLDLSAVLVPEIMAADKAAEAEAQLRLLARRVIPVTDWAGLPPQMLFTRLQQYLQTILSKLPLTQKWSRKANTPLQPLLPGLLAIYSHLDQRILVFNSLSPDQILHTDWHKVAQKVPPGCRRIHITTLTQLALGLLYARPLDITLRKYQHNWGIDFLASLTPEKVQLVRHAARRSSRILVESLPVFFFSGDFTDDEFLHHLIHEFQNKLLNVRLEHELLGRLGIIDPFALPGSLPGRHTPAAHRVAALIMRLDWWTRSYFELQTA